MNDVDQTDVDQTRTQFETQAEWVNHRPTNARDFVRYVVVVVSLRPVPRQVLVLRHKLCLSACADAANAAASRRRPKVDVQNVWRMPERQKLSVVQTGVRDEEEETWTVWQLKKSTASG